jgi:hypothetical protein
MGVGVVPIIIGTRRRGVGARICLNEFLLPPKGGQGWGNDND